MLTWAAPGRLCAVHPEQAEAPKSSRRGVLGHRTLRISSWLDTKPLSGILGYPGNCLILFFEDMDLGCVFSVLQFTPLRPDL